MAKSQEHAKGSTENSDSSNEGSEAKLEFRRPLKSPLNRKGMSPQKLLSGTGLLSDMALDVMTEAIQAGCGQVPAHGE